MKRLSIVFKAGTRASNLALIQARDAFARIELMLPGIKFQEVALSSPGDRDRQTDLRESAPDFFTRDLDQAVLCGTLDCALHSAKDLPDPLPAGLDGCWLPWREDPRDVLVLRNGLTFSSLPPHPIAGSSSERRDAYCREHFPGARIVPIRGTIEGRLAQLDAGAYDLLIMAGAALKRLGLDARIAQWIPLADMPVPEGQGVLALTFKAGDPRFLRLRSLFVKAVSFVGAGAGDANACTVAGIKALGRCDVCLYDSLMDPALLDALPPGARRIDVGKRCGQHSLPQREISQMIADLARKGCRVVRLKGGDPGIFGRLAEEVEVLEQLQLPYRVIPGVSSLNAATTGTGMLLTRRGVSRGFCVMTPRQQGGGVMPVAGQDRAKLPVVFFMAIGVAGEVAREMIADGTPAHTPAAMVFNAGRHDERIIRGELGSLSDSISQADVPDEMPGLFIVGEVAGFSYRRDAGALQGRRVLLTCSQDLQEKAADVVRDYGGIPVPLPLIRLVPTSEAAEHIRRLDAYDWVVLTSPASVRCFMEVVNAAGVDVRRIPKLLACGPGTAREMRKFQLRADAEPPADFCADGVLRVAEAVVPPGARVLRLRSDKAGVDLSVALRAAGSLVDDCVLYTNERVPHDHLPGFEAVFFASGSAVEAFLETWDQAALQGKTMLVMGAPTVAVLAKYGLAADVVSPVATVDGSITALAGMHVQQTMEKMT